VAGKGDRDETVIAGSPRAGPRGHAVRPGPAAGPRPAAPFNLERLGDRSCSSGSETNADHPRRALSTARGVVTEEPSSGRCQDQTGHRAGIRPQRISKYLINTHPHPHTRQSRPTPTADDRRLPGRHDEMRAGSRARAGQAPGDVTVRDQIGKAAGRGETGSKPYHFFREGVSCRTVIENSSRLIPTFPSLFDRACLDSGDMTVSSNRPVGGTHTKSDIMIFSRGGLVAIATCGRPDVLI